GYRRAGAHGTDDHRRADPAHVARHGKRRSVTPGADAGPDGAAAPFHPPNGFRAKNRANLAPARSDIAYVRDRPEWHAACLDAGDSLRLWHPPWEATREGTNDSPRTVRPGARRAPARDTPPANGTDTEPAARVWPGIR